MTEPTLFNVQLKIDHKAGGFADEAAMLRWLHACVNCNTNNAVVAVSAVPVPNLIIEVSGGLIQHMEASGPVRAIVLDGDIEGVDGDQLKEIDGDETYVSDRGLVEIARDKVAETVRQVDAIYEVGESPQG